MNQTHDQPMTGIRVTPNRYSVCALPEDDENSQVWRLTVEYRGPGDLWAVMHLSYCLSRGGQWDHEPSPSNRTDHFKTMHRFPLEEAIERAKSEYPKLIVNGLRVDVDKGELVQA